MHVVYLNHQTLVIFMAVLRSELWYHYLKTYNTLCRSKNLQKMIIYSNLVPEVSDRLRVGFIMRSTATISCLFKAKNQIISAAPAT